MQIEDAERLLIRFIREQPETQYSSYGYDVFIPNVMRWHLTSRGIGDHREVERSLPQLSPPFYAAAWELCRRGILRPGVRQMGLQATDSGSAGDGYSVTPFGAEWARETDRDDFVPAEPQRFAQMLKPFQGRFGAGFEERAQEAVRCYGAHAYLACCVMCGAAAESILLAAAITKRGEERTMKAYAAASGRSRVQTDLLAHVSEPLRNEFTSLAVLLRYWRDEGAHGKAVRMSDNEAYTSLALLLRLAHFVNDHWSSLVTAAQQ
jgi:hypothetical protein